MAADPLLITSSSSPQLQIPSSTPPPLNPVNPLTHHHNHILPVHLIYQRQHHDDDDDDHEDDDDQVSFLSPSSSSWTRKKMKRCKTAPAMAVMKDIRSNHHTTNQSSSSSSLSSSTLVRQAAVLLIIYLSLGVLIYSFNRDHFSGVETHPVVDALYFCIVTMCTIGYGDIAPLTPLSKLFSCVFVLVGFGFIDILLSGVVNYVLDLQENIILAGIKANNQQQQKRERFRATDYIVDVAKGRMRIRLKVCLALGIGSVVLYYVEGVNMVDSVYLSVMSVTTVGYGDRAFKTMTGRLFASMWLLLSTLAVARAFLYLAEARIDKRHRKITNWGLAS